MGSSFNRSDCPLYSGSGVSDKKAMTDCKDKGISMNWLGVGLVSL